MSHGICIVKSLGGDSQALEDFVHTEHVGQIQKRMRSTFKLQKVEATRTPKWTM